MATDKPKTGQALKFPKPKILLVDIPDDVHGELRALGFNATIGTFGTPYNTTMSDAYEPILIQANLPNYSEQEIVVIDTMAGEATVHPELVETTSPGTDSFWASCRTGTIDPRPIAMNFVQESSERIHEHGGAFIVFAAERESENIVLGHVKQYHGLISSGEYKLDNWSFLQMLNEDGIYIKQSNGEEIFLEERMKHFPLWKLLGEHLKDATYYCTIQPRNSMSARWVTLARNKYGAPVAGAIFPHKESGWILLLPRLKDKSRFIVDLLMNVLPDLSPRLFPDIEGVTWVQRDEYEFPSILAFKSDIEALLEETRIKVNRLEEAIEEERQSMSYLHDLIRETGDVLVLAVKRALEVLGFQSVIDVDAQRELAGDTKDKREDLRIIDETPGILVEVKGISGLPTEENALQVWKYIAPRMKEWQTTDIRGMSVINHQRHIPALDRQNLSPFREDVLTVAQEQSLSLWTTWDLFRLVRSYQKNRWTHEQIKHLFYRNGRVDMIPSQYEYVGVIERFYEQKMALSIELQAGHLRLGDRIAFDLPVAFEEAEIASMQVEGVDVTNAIAPTFVGIITHLTKAQAREGVRVFRVIQGSSLSPE
ncbi:MAG: hypothetical protein JWL77_4822 [Chthonomonadaceae bacterium]|nr:hypothetical protein [Chthonomonadaceae bacterium]